VVIDFILEFYSERIYACSVAVICVLLTSLMCKIYDVTRLVAEGSAFIFLVWLFTSCVPFANIFRVIDYKVLVWTESAIGL
jgi:hypothetical protein